jgi:hypothetical protein
VPSSLTSNLTQRPHRARQAGSAPAQHGPHRASKRCQSQHGRVSAPCPSLVSDLFFLYSRPPLTRKPAGSPSPDPSFLILRTSPSLVSAATRAKCATSRSSAKDELLLTFSFGQVFMCWGKHAEVMAKSAGVDEVRSDTCTQFLLRIWLTI